MISIVELHCGLREQAIRDHLAGLGDLGILTSVYIASADGSITWIRDSETPTTYPTVARALEGVTIAGEEVQIVTLVTLGASEQFEGPQADQSIKTQIQRMADLQIDDALLICPVAPYAADLPLALKRLRRGPRGWNRYFVLSPEDLAGIGQLPHDVGDADLVAHAASAVSLLVGAVDPNVQAGLLPLTDGETFRVLRPMWRSLDLHAAETLLTSQALDLRQGVFEGERSVAVEDQPMLRIDRELQDLVTAHKLRFRRAKGSPTLQTIGLSAAIRMLIAFIAKGMREAPGKLVKAAAASVRARAEAAVTRVVVGGSVQTTNLVIRAGGPDQLTAITVDEFEAGLEAVRSELFAGMDDEYREKWLRNPNPEAEGDLFESIVDACHSMLDGGGGASELVSPASLVVPPFLSAADRTALLASVGMAEPGTGARLALLIADPLRTTKVLGSDPWKLDGVIRLLAEAADTAPVTNEAEAPANVETEGEQSTDEKEDDEPDPFNPSDSGSSAPSSDTILAPLLKNLTSYRSVASASFLYRVGDEIRNSLASATSAFMATLEELADPSKKYEWSPEPENMARKRIKRSFGLLIVGVVLAVVVQFFDVVNFLVIVLGVVGIIVGVVAFLIWTAIRYQRAVFARQFELDKRQHLFGQADREWNAIHRFRVLYRQFQDWAAIVHADVQDPVGRLGELVVYGAQQTTPRWATSAITVEFREGFVNQVRRNVFQHGWRARSFRGVSTDLLRGHERTQGLESGQVDPYRDVRDAFGGRTELLRSFVVAGESGIRKRRHLEESVNAHVWAGGRLVTGDRVEAVQGRYQTFASVADFASLDCDGPAGMTQSLQGIFARAGMSGHSDISAVDESDLVYPPSLIDISGSTRASGREAPTLISSRLDISHPLRIRDEAGAGPPPNDYCDLDAGANPVPDPVDPGGSSDASDPDSDLTDI